MTADQVRIELIKTYASGLESLWGFYFTVIVGAVAILGGLLGQKGQLDRTTAVFLVGILALFGVANFAAMWQMSDLINLNIDELEDPSIRAIFEGQKPRYVAIFAQFFGWLGATWFIWSKRSQKPGV